MSTPFFLTRHGDGGPLTRFLGKMAARADSVKFKLKSYLNTQEIVPPASFGHVRNDIDWGMLGNAVSGSCVVSGAAHEIMLWTRVATGHMAPFDDATVLRQYAEASGWNGQPNDLTDTGLDMGEYASRRRKTGIVDSDGKVHLVTAYAACQSVDDVIKASYVFGAIGVGIQFPESASDQFDRHEVWRPRLRSKGMGGHYITVCGRNRYGHIICITWGRLQAMTPEFLEKYMDESVAYISPDYFNSRNLTPRLFDMAKLRRDLAAISAA